MYCTGLDPPDVVVSLNIDGRKDHEIGTCALFSLRLNLALDEQTIS
jgi:hypothetical protein